MKITYNIHVSSELSSGLGDMNDTVTVNVYSGNPGGAKGEFIEYIRQALAEWYEKRFKHGREKS